MRQAPLRTLLVVSERPHPWAFLRDRLNPDLVTVAWARPAGAGRQAAPWMVAGTGGDAGCLAGFAGRLLCWHWVGPVPAGLPARPLAHDDWHGVAAAVERALARRLAGVRLAPGAGLVLPDGSYLAGTAGLEALLAAHPDGLEPGAMPSPRTAIQRASAQIARHGLALRLAREDGRLALVEDR